MLGWADWPLNLAAAHVDESLFEVELPENYVKRLAVSKSQTLKEIPANDFIIAADTIVVLGNQVLGKPAGAAQAFQTLAGLRGRAHWVMTAVAVLQGAQAEPRVDFCKTEVRMREYSDSEIYQYIESGDAMDKAGAYAIQNQDFRPVVNFGGCMASVMGLPLCHMERTLRSFRGYEATDWPGICQFKLKYNCPVTKRIMAGENVG